MKIRASGYYQLTANVMKLIGEVNAEWSPAFALKQAVEAQVAKEDMEAWAKSETPSIPEAVLGKELPSQKWSPAMKYGFLGSIIGYANIFKL